MRVFEDPHDPVFVTAGLAPGRVELQIGEAQGSRYVRLRPEDARAVAQALLQAADLVDSPRRRP